VHVCIVEAGGRERTPEIEAHGLRASEGLDLRGRSNGRDAAAANGDRLDQGRAASSV
jgi:hypothetical protein